MTREREEQLKIIVKRLARYYNDSQTRTCACAGFGCLDLGCAQWWEFFLKKYTKDDIQRMIRAYEIVRDGR